MVRYMAHLSRKSKNVSIPFNHMEETMGNYSRIEAATHVAQYCSKYKTFCLQFLILQCYVMLGYDFTPYQQLWLYNGAPLVAFYDMLGIRRTYSRLKPPASSRGGGYCNDHVLLFDHYFILFTASTRTTTTAATTLPAATTATYVFTSTCCVGRLTAVNPIENIMAYARTKFCFQNSKNSDKVFAYPQKRHKENYIKITFRC